MWPALWCVLYYSPAARSDLPRTTLRGRTSNCSRGGPRRRGPRPRPAPSEVTLARRISKEPFSSGRPDRRAGSYGVGGNCLLRLTPRAGGADLLRHAKPGARRELLGHVEGGPVSERRRLLRQRVVAAAGGRDDGGAPVFSTRRLDGRTASAGDAGICRRGPALRARLGSGVTAVPAQGQPPRPSAERRLGRGEIRDHVANGVAGLKHLDAQRPGRLCVTLRDRRHGHLAGRRPTPGQRENGCERGDADDDRPAVSWHAPDSASVVDQVQQRFRREDPRPGD